MKPLFTKAGPPLSETLPGWCGSLANCLSKPNVEEAKAQVYSYIYYLYRIYHHLKIVCQEYNFSMYTLYHYSFAHPCRLTSWIIHSSAQCWLCIGFSTLKVACELTKRDNRVSVIRRLHWNGEGNLKIAVFARIWSCKACIFIYVRACPQLTIFARL
jgi:hypothetical protein